MRKKPSLLCSRERLTNFEGFLFFFLCFFFFVRYEIVVYKSDETTRDNAKVADMKTKMANIDQHQSIKKILADSARKSGVNAEEVTVTPGKVKEETKADNDSNSSNSQDENEGQEQEKPDYIVLVRSNSMHIFVIK